MEERVDELVPYGYADVEISTFHAFGDRMLREHSLEVGLAPDFRVLSRAEQVIFFRDRLFEFPLERYRPLGDPDAAPPGDHRADQPLQGRGHLARGVPRVRGAAAARGRGRADDDERARPRRASRRELARDVRALPGADGARERGRLRRPDRARAAISCARGRTC